GPPRSPREPEVEVGIVDEQDLERALPSESTTEGAPRLEDPRKARDHLPDPDDRELSRVHEDRRPGLTHRFPAGTEKPDLWVDPPRRADQARAECIAGGLARDHEHGPRHA